MWWSSTRRSSPGYHAPESDWEGGESSTTKLRDTSVEKLFSGGPKHVNVHAAGTGNPPILTCADLREEG
jgi:hypothetical protein